jgi:FdhD protein
VSAPTSLAIDLARDAGLMLVGFARPGRHVIYHPGGTSRQSGTSDQSDTSHQDNPARTAG